MSPASERESVIRVALSILNDDGWSTEYGKNSSGFVLVKGRERLLLVGHGRWNINADEHDQLYGRLLKLYSRHPEATRGAVVLPISAREYINAVSKQVREALGVELALIDPAAGTMQWLGQPASKPDYVDLDDREPPPAQQGGVLARLRRIFT